MFKPVRVIRSEEEMRALAPDSLACPAYSPESVCQKDGEDSWYEPGTDEAFTTAGTWEWMTGAYETTILDEDREVWVLWDAAEKDTVKRPLRGEDSHDYLTLVRGEDPEYVTHPTLEAARALIEDRLANGPSEAGMNIFQRPSKEDTDFRPAGYFAPGTELSQLPWRRAVAGG